jgi:pimeloyl-ACP methyl ester carboxylesterase
VLRAYGDGNLFGEPYGEGPIRVVWLHGWARRGQDFAPAASQLASAGVASVAFDLPGFGSSPAPASSGGARHYAELLVPALRGLGDEPLVLVGHSFGGRVATVIAATDPELVRALVLTGVPLIRTSATAKSPLAYRLVRWLHGRGLLGDRRLEAARQKYGSPDYRRASGVIRDVLVTTVNESYEDELRRLRAPVAMVWGALDGEVPVDVARRAATMVASPHTLRVVEGVGHLLPTEAPGELVDTVREALA